MSGSGDDPKNTPKPGIPPHSNNPSMDTANMQAVQAHYKIQSDFTMQMGHLAGVEQHPALTILQYTIPASQTKEGKERLRAYYEALGRFMDMFAEVETALTLTLRYYAQTPTEIAKVIFQNTTAEFSIGATIQLAKATNATLSRLDDLEYIRLQFNGIKEARNWIMHYGASLIAEGKGFVSNALKAKETPFVFPISPTLLDEMTADLRKITFHLNHHHLGIASLNHLALLSALHAPWRYRHPKPTK